MSLTKKLFSLEDWRFRISRRIEPIFRPNWPARKPLSTGAKPRVAVVTVNYNTKELLARLIFSLRRFTEDQVEVGPIVVIDNNSRDGSVELISKLTEAKVIVSVLNKHQGYHGPGLNQGVELLRERAAQGLPGYSDIDYVFVVDSDVFICRNEVFSHAIAAMKSVKTTLAGEFEANEYIQGGYAHVSSLLFDPAASWRRGFSRFENHGVPALEYQRTVIKKGLSRLDFPFRSHFYLIHLWSGTLKAICSANENDNKFFDWAMADLPTSPSVDQQTQYVIDEFEHCFRNLVPSYNADVVVKACLDTNRLTLKRPYEVAPKIPFSSNGQISDVGLVIK